MRYRARVPGLMRTCEVAPWSWASDHEPAPQIELRVAAWAVGAATTAPPRAVTRASAAMVADLAVLAVMAGTPGVRGWWNTTNSQRHAVVWVGVLRRPWPGLGQVVMVWGCHQGERPMRPSAGGICPRAR